MSVFKCKMCGGTIEFEPGATVGICDSCGTRQTLPRLDDDRRANLYDRANHFRRNNEFDKAAAIYEQILNEDTADAEAYWSLVLCRYGIEYVEDPGTHRRVPTVNRAQFTSIFDDDNYKSAIQYADGYQRTIYEEEAETINEIQKGILAISQKEEPFDVFICYKETDNNGRRTQDSVLANDLYHQLTQEGLKVFFARITLEDKLGTAYEPYIFAALNSAKVMVVLGTKPEHFNAVWVKNEWSRYLLLVKQSGGKKVLIPAYRDMDPYDLPDEFSHLQAQDMSKLGFMQDLIRGIKKITSADQSKATPIETVVVNSANANAAPLLRRAFMFLEDGEWTKADDFCEQVLNIDPENAQAYLGKLMAELHVRKQEDLRNCEKPFDDRNNYQKAVRFGSDELSFTLKGYITYINERNEATRLNGIYNNAVNAMKRANSEDAYRKAAAVFQTIPGMQDADELAEQCLNRAEECRKDTIYNRARDKMTEATVSGCEYAIRTFQTIPGWKDANEQILVCQRKIEEIKEKEESDRIETEKRRIAAKKAAKKRKLIIAVTTLITVASIVFVILLFVKFIIPNQKRNRAIELLKSADYDAAYALLEEIGDYDAITSSKHDRAINNINAGNYKAAYALLEEIDEYDTIASNKIDRALVMYDSGDSDAAFVLLGSISYTDGIVSNVYDKVAALIDSGNYQASLLLLEALSKFSRPVSDKFDPLMEKCKKGLNSAIEVGSPFFFGTYEQDNDLSNGKEDIEWLVLAEEEDRYLLLSRYVLDCQQYNSSTDTATSWETCSLREWLNGAFYSNAFSADEQQLIQSTTVINTDAGYGTTTDNDTIDKVFLLSITEADEYFDSDSARICKGTAYCSAQGAYIANDGSCWWMLRSGGVPLDFAAFVFTDGSVSKFGFINTHDDVGIRPALWVKQKD